MASFWFDRTVQVYTEDSMVVIDLGNGELLRLTPDEARELADRIDRGDFPQKG